MRHGDASHSPSMYMATTPPDWNDPSPLARAAAASMDDGEPVSQRQKTPEHPQHQHQHQQMPGPSPLPSPLSTPAQWSYSGGGAGLDRHSFSDVAMSMDDFGSPPAQGGDGDMSAGPVSVAVSSTWPSATGGSGFLATASSGFAAASGGSGFGGSGFVTSGGFALPRGGDSIGNANFTAAHRRESEQIDMRFQSSIHAAPVCTAVHTSVPIQAGSEGAFAMDL